MAVRSRSGLLWLKFAAALGLVLAAGSPVAIGQSKADASISGFVIDGVTKRPIEDASVSLRLIPQASITAPQQEVSGPRLTPRVLTASNGGFAFRMLAQGRYRLAASKSGYPLGTFGQQSPNEEGQYFDLRQSESARGIILTLWPGADLSGTVRSRSGAGVPNRWVQAFYLDSTGAAVGLQLPETSDDRGDYQFTGLRQGRYIIRLSTSMPPPPAVSAFPDSLDSTCVFYPDTPVPTAAGVVTVSSGDQRTGLDFVAPDLPVQGYRVSGSIQGVPISRLERRIRLILGDEPGELPRYLEIATASIESDGSFQFPYVPPGQYRVRGVFSADTVQGGDIRQDTGGFRVVGSWNNEPVPPVPPMTAWIDQAVVVSDRSITGLRLRAQAGSRIVGQIILAPDATAVDLTRLAIVARSLDGWNLDGLTVGRANRDGGFSSAALPPGKYTITPRSAEELYVESASLSGRETLATGIDVGGSDIGGLLFTISRSRAHITGRIVDRSGGARPDAYVLYLRRTGNQLAANLAGEIGADFGRVRTNRFGDYDLALTAGDYFVAAVMGALPETWRNGAFLQPVIARANKVSISRGGKLVLNLVAEPSGK